MREFLVGEEVFDCRLGVGFLGDLAGEVVVPGPVQPGTEEILGEVCVTSSRSSLLASAEEGFAERYGLGVSEAEDGLGVADSRGGVWFLSDCVREDVPLGVVTVLFDVFVLVAALHAVGVGLLERVEDPMHPAVRVVVCSDSGTAGIEAGLGERIHAEVVVLERE